MTSKLPVGWTSANLGALIELKYGKALPHSERTGDGYPVFGSNGIVGAHAHALSKGQTLVIGRKGSVGQINFSAIACSPIDTTYYVDQVPGDQFRFWFHALQSLGLESLNKSTAIPGLSRSDVYSLLFPVPPLAEQQRIADKLDTVLARVDACRDRLARVAPLLKRFRQSVLAAATSQGLTIDRDKDECYDIWTSARIGDVIRTIDQGWSPKCEAVPADSDKDWAIIKTTSIQAGHFLDFENKRLPPDLSPKPSLEIREGDVLITRAGPRARAGVSCLVVCTRPRLMLCDKAYRIRVNESQIQPAFLNVVLNSPEVVKRIDALKTGISESGVNLTQDRFLAILIQFPSLEKQTEIVRRVETLFAFADRLEARLAKAQTAVERLTPSLLAKAFRGELVPQDPNDEPAAELLKRLAAQRDAAPGRTRRSRVTPSEGAATP